MRRVAALVAVVLAAGWAGTARPAEMAPGFRPPEKRIEKPYTDDKCLDKCHGVPGFAAGDETGRLRDLYVDPAGFVQSVHARKGIECVDCHVDADPNFHPRTGYPNVDCRACHAARPPADAYPPHALARLKAKGIKRPPEEARKAEGWMKTRHGEAWAGGKENAPFCRDCHTAHRVFPAEDARSSVNRARLKETCGRCHREQVEAGRPGALLARFRIGGHGKGDLSTRYDVSECVSCHQGEAAHGERTVTGQACSKCHRPEAAGKAGLATLHIRPGSSDQPLARVLGWAYEGLFWLGVAGATLFVLFIGFSSLYRRDDG